MNIHGTKGQYIFGKQRLKIFYCGDHPLEGVGYHPYTALLQISRYSEQDDLVLSRDFEVRGQTRILRCEVVVLVDSKLVEGGRESGTRQQVNEAKI